MANTVNAHQKILEDLYQIFPIEVAPIMPPYDEDATMDSKFETLKEAIRRSKRLGDRRLHLKTKPRRISRSGHEVYGDFQRG
ncbi:unnamed protein product [Rhizophagus irregularis]|nr:unnamed protein product [Rhizophagus irregularis]